MTANSIAQSWGEGPPICVLYQDPESLKLVRQLVEQGMVGKIRGQKPKDRGQVVQSLANRYTLNLPKPSSKGCGSLCECFHLCSPMPVTMPHAPCPLSSGNHLDCSFVDTNLLWGDHLLKA